MSSSELSGALDPSAISHNPYYVQYRTPDGYYYHTQPLQAEPPQQLEQQPQQGQDVYGQQQQQEYDYSVEQAYVPGYQQNALGQADIAPLQSSVTALESALEAERTARGKLERRLVECANELRGLQATFQSALDAQQSAANAQLERALQQRNHSDNVWRGELEKRLGAIEDMNARLSEQGQRSEERCTRLEELAQRLQATNDRLEARNGALEERCSRAESRLSAVEARAQSAEETARRVEEVANEAQTEAREANDRIDALFKEHSLLKSARMAPPVPGHGLPSPRSLPSTSPMFANAMPTPAASTPARPTSPAVYRTATQSSLAQPVASSSAVTLDKVSAYDAPASPSLFPQPPYAYSPTTSAFPSRISSPQPAEPVPAPPPPSTRGQKRSSDDEPKDTRPSKKRDHHDKRPHTVQTAMRKHMWLVMNIPEDSLLPEPHPENDVLAPNAPVRFNWHKTIKQSKHNQAMKTRVLTDIRTHASELYPEVPQFDITHPSLATTFDSVYTTVRSKWKQQNDAAEKEKVRQREIGKSQRSRRVGRKKTKLTGRQDARKRKAEFNDRRFDGAMQVDCMSSEESDGDDPSPARVGTGAGTGGDDNKTLVLRGKPWRSSRLLRFYGALDAEEHRYIDLKPRRGVGRRLRKEGEPRERALPPSGVSRWMVSRRWMARMQREDPLSLEALEFADDEDEDWSRYEMLGYESEDEEAGFLDERGAQVARNAPNYSLMGALAGPSES